MRKLKRLWALLLTIVILLPLVCVFPAHAIDPNSNGYKKKRIAIVYDDSGSMNWDLAGQASTLHDSRDDYARYAMQMLIALLNPGDTLDIVLMNHAGFSVSLDSTQSREQTVRDTIARLPSPSGSTPGGNAIRQAIECLKSGPDGLKPASELAGTNDTEYWLIVLTDGVFDTDSGKLGAEEAFEKYVVDQKFSALRSVYVAFGKSGVTDLRGSDLTNKIPFTAYRAEANIAEVMQQIAAQLTGRFEPGLALQGQSTTVRIPVPDGYAMDSVSIVAQDIGATITSATYERMENGTPQSEAVQITQNCVIDASEISNIQNGYSAVLKRQSSYFLGGDLVLTFSSGVDPGKIAVFVEPTLDIQPYVVYQGREITWQEMNAKLTQGKQISVRYRAFDRTSKKEVQLSTLFGNTVTDSVTYNAQTYAVGQEFPVAVGKNEIVVTVNAMNGKYLLYGSLFCNIEPNPTEFRIESEITKNYGNDPLKFRVDYTVYIDNTPVPVSTLATRHFAYQIDDGYDNSGNNYVLQRGEENGKAYAVIDISGSAAASYFIKMTVKSDDTVAPRDARSRTEICEIDIGTRVEGMRLAADAQHPQERVEFTFFVNDTPTPLNRLDPQQWSVSATGPNGNPVAVDTQIVGDKLIAVPDTEHNPFGAYDVQMEVLWEGKPMSGHVSVGKYPQALEIRPVSCDLTSIRQYAFIENTSGMTWELLADGQPIAFDDPIIRYRLLLESDTVTEYATLAGNTLGYVPRDSHLSAANRAIGTKTVKLIVSCPAGGIGDTVQEVAFQLEKTEYMMEAVPLMEKTVDRFHIDKFPAGVYFRLTRDGIPLSEDELQKMYASGEVKIDLPFALKFFLLPCGVETGVETVNGEPLLYCKVKRDQAGILATFTAALIFNGNKSITASYGGAAATDGVTFAASPIFEYIWRFLLFALIVYIIIYIIGFFTCKMLPKGTLVTVTVTGDEARVKCNKVNLSTRSIVSWHIKRFFIGGLRNQLPVKYGSTKILLAKDGVPNLNFAGSFTGISPASYIKGGNVDFDKMCASIEKGHRVGLKITNQQGKNLKSKAFIELFDIRDSVIEPRKNTSLKNRTYYVLFKAPKNAPHRREIRQIVFFMSPKKGK